ncbi:MAG: hypothetical protein AAFP90_04490 [Planctomycetota bacterium]
MITSNHAVILGDQPRKVEFGADGKEVSAFTQTFEIDGKDSGQSAMFFLCVKGLVGESAQPVEVAVNGQPIGKLMPNSNAAGESWFTQTLHFSKSEGSLNPNEKEASTENVIRIPAEGTGGGEGKFYVQNVFVLYKAEFDA